MFSFGGPELLLIGLIAFVLFGPDKLPQIARTIGRYTREFRKYRDIMESSMRAEVGAMDEMSPWQQDYERHLAEEYAKATSEGAEEVAAADAVAGDEAADPEAVVADETAADPVVADEATADAVAVDETAADAVAADETAADAGAVDETAAEAAVDGMAMATEAGVPFEKIDESGVWVEASEDPTGDSLAPTATDDEGGQG